MIDSVHTSTRLQVDKIWSLLPPFYLWLFTFQGIYVYKAPLNPRIAIMAVIATVWGLRLTYNFYRKGGYSWSGEDYRC